MNDALETTARILGRCTIIGLLMVSVWFVAYITGLLCGPHEKMFGLSEHECALLSYGGMGIFKILIYTFFLFPWIAIRLELHRRRKGFGKE